MNSWSNRSKMAVVTAMAIVGLFAGASRAHAQQKSPTAPSLVRNIDEPGFNEFQFSQNVLFTNPSFTASIPVPLNKVLVVEHVSASGLLDTGGVVQVFVRCFNGSMEVNHSLVLTPQGSVNGWAAWSVSQPIKCYATTQQTGSGGLFIHLQTSFINSNQHTWTVAVSGYTVPQ